jgi:MOSC domain-containing protein YiiM
VISEGLIVSVRAGRVRERPRPAWDHHAGSPWRTAYGKDEIAGPARIGRLGLEGDEQAETDVHGGPQMAVLAYANAHYAHWRQVPGLEAMAPGGFAENLTVEGPDEHTVCIGDVYEAGAVRLQVASPRGPCASISRWWNEPSMVKRATESARVGWYHRVLREGTLAAGDAYRLVERPCPDWTVARVFHARVGPKRDAAEMRALARLPELSPEWQGHFARLLEKA